MMRLTAHSPAAGLTPVTHGAATLSERAAGPAFLIAPFDVAAADAALRKAGLGYPQTGRVLTGAAGSVLWFGHDTALLLAADCPDMGAAAAVTAYGDALCHLTLDGEGAEAVLARLVPLDLRPRAFAADAAARTLLGRIAVSVRRAGASGFDLIVARSFAQSAVETLTSAMQRVAAR